MEKVEKLHETLKEVGDQKRIDTTLNNLQKHLISIQMISDEKLFIVQSICEQLDLKARQLDLDYRSVTSGNSFSSIVSPVKPTREFGRDHQHLTAAASNNQNFTPNSSLTTVPEVSTGDTDQPKLNEDGSSQESIVATGVASADPEETDDCEMESTCIVSSQGSSSKANGNQHLVSSPSKRGGKRNYHGRGGNRDTGRDTGRDTDSASKGRGGKRYVKSKDVHAGKRSKHNRDNSPPPSLYEENPIDPDEPTYCLCNQISFGEMICCDNTSCVLEWFHFQCVQLTTKPKGKWYCPQCRGDRSNVLKK